MFRHFIIVICIFLLPIFAGAYDDIQELNLSSDGIESLKINCGSGFLKVYGQSGLDEIKVKAEIRLTGVDEDDVKEILDRYLELSLEKRGSRAILISYFEGNQGFFSRIRNVSIDLTVHIPENIDLLVDDGSGSMELEDISGMVEIEDGSGSIEINKITGDVFIDDGSGEIDVIEINGELEIDDGSGDIYADNINGDVYVDDGSGSIRIREIQGTVKVSDGSGSIRISDVSEDVIIKESGSGSVSISNVDGKIHRYDEDW